MKIDLTEDLEAFVRAQVAQGRFPSESAVIETALRQMRDRARRMAEVQRQMLEQEELETI